MYAAPAVTESQTAELAEQFRAIADRARGIVTRVGSKMLGVQPAPGKWSVGQCLAHLTLTTEAYLPLWRAAYEETRSQKVAPGADRPFKLDFWGKALVWTLEPPPKFRFPTSAPFEPKHSELPSADEVLGAFLASQDSLLRVLAESRSLPLDRIKITSPFSKRLRYSLWSSFVVNASHQRRHLWQAERVCDGWSASG